MFERTERASQRYTSNFRTSLILSSFATLNYLTDKDPELTTLCATLAGGFALFGLYEMDRQRRLRPKLREAKKALLYFWRKLPSAEDLKAALEEWNNFHL